MQTTVTKRSIVIGGRKTSISLEDEFWNGLKAIARQHQRTLSAMVGEIDQHRRGNLSSAIRVFVFDNLRAQTPALNAASDSQSPAGRSNATRTRFEQTGRQVDP
jgi:predicted DNA-binding ribbon-helix-helix protein